VGLLDVIGDAEKKTVDLVLQRGIVRLTFTDKPWPPLSASDSQPDDSPQDRGAAGGLWNSMQKTFGRLLDEASRKTPTGREGQEKVKPSSKSRQPKPARTSPVKRQSGDDPFSD
jgi:hypothetical protein